MEAKKLKTLITINTIIIFILVVAAVAFGYSYYNQNGIYVKDGKDIPYSYTMYTDHVILEKYHGDNVTVYIPESVKGKPVTEIATGCFYGSSMNEVVLHENIQTIYEGAFEQCKYLKKIYTAYTDYVVLEKYCGKEKTVNLSEKIKGNPITKIGEQCFIDNDYIVEVIFYDGIENINNNAFDNCDNFERAYTIYDDYVVLERYQGSEQVVTIPETYEGKPITAIGKYCFRNNADIIEVVLHDNIQTIYDEAFYNCSSLKKIQGGSGLKFIGNYAFSDCRQLEEVEVGEYLEKIENGSFSQCDNLKKLAPQEQVKSIGKFAFYGAGLEEFEFNNNAEVLGWAFMETPWIYNQGNEFIIGVDGNLIAYAGSDSLVVIPEDVKTIMSGSFENCEAITDIYVPETVTTIQESAFYNCKGTRLYMPTSVIEMADGGDILPYDVGTSIVIVTIEGSYAQQYAQENDISCEIVDGWEVP